MTLSTIHDDAPKNPVVRTTPLRAYPGFVVRQYADGMFDAAELAGVAISPGFESFSDAVAWLRGEGV